MGTVDVKGELQTILEDDPVALHYILSRWLLEHRRSADSNKYDRETNLNWGRYNTIFSIEDDAEFKQWVPEDVIKHAFELGFIEEAMKANAVFTAIQNDPHYDQTRNP